MEYRGAGRDPRTHGGYSSCRPTHTLAHTLEAEGGRRAFQRWHGRRGAAAERSGLTTGSERSGGTGAERSGGGVAVGVAVESSWCGMHCGTAGPVHLIRAMSARQSQRADANSGDPGGSSLLASPKPAFTAPDKLGRPAAQRRSRTAGPKQCARPGGRTHAQGPVAGWSTCRDAARQGWRPTSSESGFGRAQPVRHGCVPRHPILTV